MASGAPLNQPAPYTNLCIDLRGLGAEMLGYTHFAIAAASTEAVMLITGTPWQRAIPLVLVAGVSALLPDIDQPNSEAGRRSLGISEAIAAFCKHRGPTHTIFGLLVWAGIVFPVGLVFWGTKALPYPCDSVISVTSGCAPRRIGGPHVPAPRLTYSIDPPPRSYRP